MYTRLRMDKDNNIVKDEDGDFIKNEPQVYFSLFSIKFYFYKFFLQLCVTVFLYLFSFISRQFMQVILSVKKPNMLY